MNSDNLAGHINALELSLNGLTDAEKAEVFKAAHAKYDTSSSQLDGDAGIKGPAVPKTDDPQHPVTTNRK